METEYDLDALCKDMLLNDLKLYGMSLEEAKKLQKDLNKVIYQTKPYFEKETIKNVKKYLDSGKWITEHKETQKFEKNFLDL